MILIDDREANEAEYGSRIATWLTAKYPTAVTRLEYGDYAFQGNGPTGPMMVGVERKRVHDVMNSIRCGRLAEQVRGMCQPGQYDLVYLLLEGIYRRSEHGWLEERNKYGSWCPVKQGKNTYYMYSELDKALMTFEVMRNVIYRNTPTPEATEVFLCNLYQHWALTKWDDHHAHEAIKVQTEVSFKKASLLRRVANQITGIGWERSAVVDKQFRSVRQMAKASINEWMDLPMKPRLGEKRAQEIVAEIRGEK